MNQHLASQLSPSATSANLHQLRKQSLGRTEITGEQCGICADNTDQGEHGEIVALGEHLRADKNVGFASVDRVQQGLPFFWAACRVSINTQDARTRKSFADRLFQTLRATSKGVDVDVAAIRTGSWD